MANSARGRAGSTLLSIDRLCDEFESNWQAGKEPRIEDVLERLPIDAHPMAFRELLEIEFAVRRQRGETVRGEEYHQRFADWGAIVDEVAAASLKDGSSLKGVAETTPVSSTSDTKPNAATTCTRYDHLRFFRRGGLGALYRAVDESLHREIVVKFMNEQCEKDPALIAQFKVEAEVTGRLDHPGIVPVYGIGQDWQGRPFYVMRLINGRELKQAIQEYHDSAESKWGGRQGRQALFNLLEHLVSACNTVAYAHHVGVIHCDLKPANIMIGKYGETFVLDWGLAANFERGTTFFSPNEPTMRPHSGTGSSSSGQRGGTFGYSSPEQLLSDGPIGPTSDVYSLGATLYEILTGQSPFNGRDPNVREQIRHGEFPLPRKLKPTVCPRLEAVCLKSMALSPQARYPTAKLLANDLANWMRDEEIEAAPDRWFDRISRFGRRHRGITAAFFITLITVLIAGGLIERASRVGKAFENEKQVVSMTLDTYENLCRPFANGELNNLGLVQQLVGPIKPFTTEYVARFRDNKGMYLHTARVYELRATIARISENDAETALEDLRRAEKLYSKLPPKADEKLNRDLRLAQNHLTQGRLLNTQEKWDEARRLFESTKDDLERLQSNQPDNQELQRSLAEAHHCLGEVFLSRPAADGPARQQWLTQSEDHFTESKKIRKRLADSTTGEEHRDHVRDLARSLGWLGDVYLAKGDISRADQAYEDSKEGREELHRAKPDDPEYGLQYARGLGNFGRLERGYRGRLSVAIKNLQEAAQIQEELSRRFPEIAEFRLDLGDNQNTLAEIFLFAAAKEPDQADDFTKRARVAAQNAALIYGRPDQKKTTSGVAGLAQSLVWMALCEDPGSANSRHQAEEAEKRLELLGPEQTLDGSQLTLLAMARSLQGQTDPALRALKLAVQRGENTAYRFDEHEKLAFKALVDDANTADQFKSLVAKVGEKLKLN
jgi:serine/threonine protein kinase